MPDENENLTIYELLDDFNDEGSWEEGNWCILFLFYYLLMAKSTRAASVATLNHVNSPSAIRFVWTQQVPWMKMYL